MNVIICSDADTLCNKSILFGFNVESQNNLSL